MPEQSQLKRWWPWLSTARSAPSEQLYLACGLLTLAFSDRSSGSRFAALLSLDHTDARQRLAASPWTWAAPGTLAA